jgi:hypothetical protein
MIEIAFFYLLLLLLLLILLFIIILYSGGHARTIAPPLMNNYYGVSTLASNEIGATFSELELIDGGKMGDSGGLNFNGDDGMVPFNFEPLAGDSRRAIGGNMVMYAQADGVSRYFTLDIIDKGDNDHVVSESTDFVLMPGTSLGLQTIRLVFNTRNTSENHNLALRAKARSPDTSIPGTSIQINSAYVTYF